MKVFRTQEKNRDEELNVVLPKEQAHVLFHDLNRMLSLLEDTASGAMGKDDSTSMDRLSDLVAALERELHP